MNPVRKILVPVDFSEDSANGLSIRRFVGAENASRTRSAACDTKKGGRFLLGLTGRDGRSAYAESSGRYSCRSTAE